MAIKRKLKVDGVAGVCAVYTVEDTAIDDAPFDDPLANIERVEFHSDLDYLAVSSIHTGTLSLGAVTSGGLPYATRHDLFAHGLGYQPLVMGYLEGFGGNNVPLLGTTMIFGLSNTNTFDRYTEGWFRSVQLGAGATHVYLHEYVLRAASGSRTISAATLNWRVMVTTRNLDLSSGNNNTASHPAHVYISGDRVVFGRGKFDTDRSHIKKNATGFAVAIDKSLDLKRFGLDIQLTQSIDGHVCGNYPGDTFDATAVVMDAV